MHPSDHLPLALKADLLDTFEEALLAALSSKKMTASDAVELERRFRGLLWPRKTQEEDGAGTVKRRKFAVL